MRHMSDRPPARIAVAGAGLIGQAHIKRILQTERCELVGVADPFAQSHSGVAHFDSLEVLLQAVKPDGVIVATPNDQHLPAVSACVSARVVPLIEKPLAGSLEDALQIESMLLDANLVALVGHHRRHSAALRTAKDIIATGQLGRVVGVTGTAVFAKPDEYFDVAWRSQPGGGPVLINLVHEIDDLRFLLGDLDEISAMTSNAVRGLEVEDSAAIVMRFRSGVLGTFLLSDSAASPWSWEQTSGENLSYAHYSDEACYRIIGTKGSLTVPDFALFTAQGRASWNEPLHRIANRPEPTDPLAEQLDHFVDVLLGVCAPIVDASDALQTLAATLAVHDAARNGRTTRLAEGSVGRWSG
jgi:predicted dehydrogenase